MQHILKEYNIKSKKTGASTKNHDLINQVYLYFDKKIPYKQLLGLIKYKGYQGVYEAFNSVKHSDFINPPALFLSKLKMQKVQWTDAP